MLLKRAIANSWVRVPLTALLIFSAVYVPFKILFVLENGKRGRGEDLARSISIAVNNPEVIVRHEKGTIFLEGEVPDKIEQNRILKITEKFLKDYKPYFPQKTGVISSLTVQLRAPVAGVDDLPADKFEIELGTAED